MSMSDERPRDAHPVAGVVNGEQARAWQGEEVHWVEHEEHYNASVRRHSLRLFAAARIGPGDRVLDVGCGCGETTRAAARTASSGMALGVDLSARMIARARERSQAEGLTNVWFEQADAQVYPFAEQAFDLAISRFGAMFFADPVAAFRNIGRALRPGGRLALLSWRELGCNPWLLALRQALAAGRTLPAPPMGAPGPFGLADALAARHLLTAAGFVDIAFEEVNEPVCLGTDSDDAFAFVRTMGITRGLLQDLEEAATGQALAALRRTLAAHDSGQGVLLDSRAWLITARRP